MYNVKKFLGFFACFLLSLGITDAADFLRVCTTSDSYLAGEPMVRIKNSLGGIITSDLDLPPPGQCLKDILIDLSPYPTILDQKLSILIGVLPGYATFNTVGTVTYSNMQDFSNCYISVYYGDYTGFSYKAKATLICTGH